MIHGIRHVIFASCSLLLLIQGHAFGAGGTISGVVVAERADQSGDLQLLLAVPTQVNAAPIDEIRLDLPKKIAKQLRVNKLPTGWNTSLDKDGLILSGPPTSSRELLAIALDMDTKEALPEMGIRLLTGGRTVFSETGTPQKLAQLATLDSPEGLVQLPQAVSPGESVTFKPLDTSVTPAGGSWEIDDTDADWNGSLSAPEYEWRIALDYGYKFGSDLRLRVRYTDPWGEKLVDGNWDDTTVVSSGAQPAGKSDRPSITDCSPKILTGGILCVCGYFPTTASQTSLTLNGKPLGAPLSASRHVLNFRLSEEVPRGQFTVAGTPAGGYEGSHTASGVHIAVGGEIDRSRLMRGESTPLRLWLEGTEEPISLRLWNTTTAIVSLDPENDQIVTTSGGSTNEVTRIVHAVSPGDFVIKYELSLGSCPCAEQITEDTTPTLVAEDDPSTVTSDTTVVTMAGEGTSTQPRTECDRQAAECERLRAEAEAAESRARTLQREADRLKENGRIDDDADWLDEVSDKDREHLKTLRRQAAEWRQLAADAGANAKKNWDRHRKYPNSGWDYWAERDEEWARRRDAEAKRLDDQAKELERKIRGQNDEAKKLRDRLKEAEAGAARAAGEARRARAAYDACLARLKREWPEELETTTVVAGGTGTSIETGDGGGDDPRDTPPPTTYGEEVDDEKICPQRDGKHKDCVALLIDIARYDNWRPGSITDTKEYLEEMECDLDYVAPRFQSVPPPSYVVERSIWSWTEMRFKKTKYWVNTSHQRQAAQGHNRGQMATVNSAIEQHRAKLRAGAILGIEMFYAHGSSNKRGGCGRFGPSPDWWNNSISRKDFHEGNYSAAKSNVCIWYVADFSCYSFLSARAVDNLNNFGRTNCFYGQGFNRPFHAGYEADIAHTCGHQGVIEVCTNYDVAYLEDDIDDVFEGEIGRKKGSGYDHSNAFKDMIPVLGEAANSSVFSYSTYTDKGYEMCLPPSHTRRGPY